jgi:hypothetical protein
MVIDAPNSQAQLVGMILLICFLVVLLVTAIGLILGAEQYEWKKTLVKFILAAVFINFSKMICGLFIDIAHVVMISFLDAVIGVAGGNLITMFKMQSIYNLVGDTMKEDADFTLEMLAASVLAIFFSALMLLTIGAYLVVMLARLVGFGF